MHNMIVDSELASMMANRVNWKSLANVGMSSFGRHAKISIISTIPLMDAQIVGVKIKK